MIETSSLDLYQYFSHTLNRGEMPAGEPFQMLHLITTCESVQMSFAFLFMRCLRLFLNHLTHSPLCKCCMYISLSICLSSALQFGESAVGSAGWDWGVCHWCLRKRLWMEPSWGESASGRAAEIPAATHCSLSKLSVLQFGCQNVRVAVVRSRIAV